MNIFCNRIKIALFAICRGLFQRKGNNNSGKVILIIFQQVFGDSIIISKALQEYTKLYPMKDGYEIKMLVRPSVLNFMQNTLPLPNEIRFIYVDFSRLVNDFQYYKHILKEYCSDAAIAIVLGSSLSAELLCDGINSGRRIGLVNAVKRIWPPHIWLFQKLAYDEVVVPLKEEMMLQRHRRLLNYLGDTAYLAELPNLLSKEKIIDGDYVVICPGASTPIKRWPINKYIEIIDYVIAKYELDVHLCGGAEEAELVQVIMSKAKQTIHIISHVGKTSFSDWSAIVQHARLVIGNDSATLHLAAAGRIPSICIAGVYDKYQFFPYRVDKTAHDDILPETITVDVSCAWCRTKGYFAGYGNTSCKIALKENKCALCISAVTVGMVEEKIDAVLNTEK